MGSGLRSAPDKVGFVYALDLFFLPTGGMDLTDGGEIICKNDKDFRMMMLGWGQIQIPTITCKGFVVVGHCGNPKSILSSKWTIH
ncbi:hypothetical protein L1987_77115 [Smallanthus sonchifolius]|uniref:Uncharacterized protein n=1 Tax=Smallanthus sonchifolius TaxID=185202 RepID=A0ACB8Z836_9ASTR|nr:hypothetical protein L1987_77115 [Smallanthus sonchifolius]